MVTQVISGTTVGIEGHKIIVETDIAGGVPAIIIVGLPDTAMNEARERIRGAFRNSNIDFPIHKVVINLAPADLKKEGSLYDLPMAVGILTANGDIDITKLDNTAFMGELSLDGSIRSVAGILPIVLGLKEQGITRVFVPKDNQAEAALVEGVEVYGLSHLCEVLEFFSDEKAEEPKLKPFKIDIKKYLQDNFEENPLYDFKDVKGQQKAKRALEIAAAGGHNILMVGSPGAGKTLLSKCFTGILPPLELSEAMELTKIYSISGLVEKDKPLVTKRPFRPVHHSASAVGITGGGSNPKPGEITLAHRGTLFLDEVVEFPRQVLEVLRQPLEDGMVTITRAQHSIRFPADFTLLAAMNPCPCGFHGDSAKECTCSPFQIQRYWAKLSGPLLDRIDIQINVPRLKEDELLSQADGEPSKVIRERVIRARNLQLERFKDENIVCNSQMLPKQIKRYCALDDATKMVLKNAITKFNLSGRAYDRILKLSRTIADLDNSVKIETKHILEAIQYRNLDRQG